MSTQYEKIQQAARFLQNALPFRPDTAVVLGTGLGCLEQLLTPDILLNYVDIPNFKPSTAPSHAGHLLAGRIGSNHVIIMSGRMHAYEGYSNADVALPVQALRLLGLRVLILTNGCGCLNPDFAPGSYMLLNDHISFFSQTPLAGPNMEELGPRFFDVSPVYSPRLRELAKKCAAGLPLTIHEGVYAYMPGPEYETPAEVRALRLLGADAVGMSTVPEAVAAAHCGLPVLAISHLANMAVGLTDGPVDCSVVQNDKTPLLHLLRRLLEHRAFLEFIS